MKRIGCVLALLLAGLPAAASAQNVRGYAGAAVPVNVNADRYAAAGGGVVVDLGTPWLSAGGQAEVLVSWPYFAGRGALFGQVNVPNRSPFRPFVIAGRGMGEEAGPVVVGGGVEMRRPGTRYGFRVSVEDYVSRYDWYLPGPAFVIRTSQQIVLRGAVLF